MANQRPIRRPRIPRWKRGRRRPVRWIEGNSTGQHAGPEICSIDAEIDATCEPNTPRVLVYGDSDWDWADNSEVRIDRILGQLQWDAVYGFSPNSLTPVIDSIPWLLRLGVLAVEEAETQYPTIDLWDREALEEFQWMWLYQTQGNVLFHTQPTDGPPFPIIFQYENIPIDISTRRSLGKKDAVLLYFQAKYHTDQELPVSSTGRVPRLCYQIRTIVRA